jgi:quercetin dioxygenase-like cupin family protein
METGYTITALDPATEERFLPLRRVLGVTTFGLNQIVLREGQRGRIHRHTTQEEVYLVWAGTLRLTIEGEVKELERGELARVAPGLRREIANVHEEDCVLIALGGAHEHVGRDGEAFESWDQEQGRPPQEVPLPADLK